MLSVQNVDKLFRDFAKQTLNGSLKIVFANDLFSENPFAVDIVDYKIGLNYIIEGKEKIENEQNPTLNISNYKTFIENLTELMNKKYEYHYNDKNYMTLTEEGYLNFLLMGIISNMQEMDFNYPIGYLNRMIDAYDKKYEFDNKKEVGNFKIGDLNTTIVQYDRKNMATMETMVSRQFLIKKDDQEVLLPRIHYYISGNKVYILGIQNYSKDKDNSLSKKVDRYLRKMDKGLEEYEQSDNGKVEGIKDISVAALASLVLFMSSYSEYQEFYMTDYLPIRYMNKLKNDVTDEDINKIDKIQTNITDKFLMTGVRLCEHFDNLDCDFFNGVLKIDVSEYKHQEGNIIYDLYESIKTMKKR